MPHWCVPMIGQKHSATQSMPMGFWQPQPLDGEAAEPDRCGHTGFGGLACSVPLIGTQGLSIGIILLGRFHRHSRWLLPA